MEDETLPFWANQLIIHITVLYYQGGLGLKVLVVYYSLQGNSKCVGDHIADLLKADVEELKTVKPMDPSHFITNFRKGKKENQVEEVEIKPPKHDPNKYDLIVIGTPVWAWAPAPPVYAYLKKMNIKGKKLALYSCSEGEAGRTLEKMKGLLKDSKVLSEREFINPRNDMNGTCSMKAQEWARSLSRLSK